MRNQANDEQRSGVDTLLAHLYLDTGQSAALESLVGEIRNQCHTSQLVAVLRGADRHRAAAMLLESAGDEAAAVAVWAALARGEVRGKGQVSRMGLGPASG